MALASILTSSPEGSWSRRAMEIRTTDRDVLGPGIPVPPPRRRCKPCPGFHLTTTETGRVSAGTMAIVSRIKSSVCGWRCRSDCDELDRMFRNHVHYNAARVRGFLMRLMRKMVWYSRICPYCQVQRPTIRCGPPGPRPALPFCRQGDNSMHEDSRQTL